MPSGQKSVVWTQENVSKLLNANSLVHNIDYDAVAKEFGAGINSAAIARYLYQSRVKARKNGHTMGAARGDSMSITRRRKTGGGKNALKAGNNDSNDDLDQGKDESNQASVPPHTPIEAEHDADKVLHGRVAKRTSPRKDEKKDYRNMGDSVVGMDDLKDNKGQQEDEDEGVSYELSDLDIIVGPEVGLKSTDELMNNGGAI